MSSSDSPDILLTVGGQGDGGPPGPDGPQGPQGDPALVLGVYATDAAAAAGGIAVGQIYRRPNGLIAYRQALKVISKVAVVGDSVTENAGGAFNAGYGPGTGVGSYVFLAIGWVTWFRYFCDCGFDLVPNPDGSKMTFGYSGFTVEQIYAAAQANVLASPADLITDMGGTNNIGGTMTFQQIVDVANHRLAFWQACRTAGKEVMALGIPPFGAAVGAAASANQVIYNNQCEALAHANGFDFTQISYLMEQSPGVGATGVYNNDDNFHPAENAAFNIGRNNAQVFLSRYVPGINRKAVSSTYIVGGNFATGAGAPAGWGNNTPAGASIVSQSVVADATGNWWKIKVDMGTSNAPAGFNFYTVFQPGDGSLPGKKIDGIMELQVLSGSMSAPNLRLVHLPSNGVISQTAANQYNKAQNLTAADGVHLFSTQPALLPAGTTGLAPFVDMRGNGVVEFMIRGGIRQLS